MYKKKPTNNNVKEKFCYFCSNNLVDIDYKKPEMIGKFCSNYAKILPKKRMGSCTKHQRKLAQAVKRARFMALLPYVK